MNPFLVSRPLWSLSHSPKTSITRLRFFFSSPASLRDRALGPAAPAPSASPPSAPGPAASPAAAGVAGLEAWRTGLGGRRLELGRALGRGRRLGLSPSPGGAPLHLWVVEPPEQLLRRRYHPDWAAALGLGLGLARGRGVQQAASVSACASRSRFSCIFCSFFSCSACGVMYPATAIWMMRICTRCHVAASSCAACRTRRRRCRS